MFLLWLDDSFMFLLWLDDSVMFLLCVLFVSSVLLFALVGLLCLFFCFGDNVLGWKSVANPFNFIYHYIAEVSVFWGQDFCAL